MRRYVAVTLHLTMLHIREQKLHPCYTSTVRKRQQNQAINAEKPPFRTVFLTKLSCVDKKDAGADTSEKAARRAAHKIETQQSGFDFERRSDGVNER